MKLNILVSIKFFRHLVNVIIFISVYFTIQVLKRLIYIDNDKTLRHKGRVAFEISTHEVMITELLINNVLTDLDPVEVVAILSCFVFEMVRWTLILWSSFLPVLNPNTDYWNFSILVICDPKNEDINCISTTYSWKLHSWK